MAGTGNPEAQRTVHCGDGVAWLRKEPLADDCAVLTSLPDHGEMRRSFAEWQAWFTDAAAAVVAATAPASAAVFFQTDVKREGLWVDKAQLVLAGAAAAGGRLLWHKVVCRAPAGTATYGRPGYAHLLCVSRGRVDAVEAATADVLPRLGAMTWPRAIGLDAAAAAVGWLAANAGARTIVDPFCGIGTVLAVANRAGLHAVGVELAPGRAEQARVLAVPAVPPSALARSKRVRPALLADDDVRARLAALPGWTFADGALRAAFRCRDFAAAFAFMTDVAETAEAMDHHPDWRNVWSRVDVALSTHDAGGVTELDFGLARAIDAAAVAHGAHRTPS